MGQEAMFAISYMDLQGKEGSAINYDQVIVALPAGAVATSSDYDSLAAVIPRDPRDPRHPARYCRKTSQPTPAANQGEPVLDLCTGDASCNGGPEPKSALKRLFQKVKHKLGFSAEPPFGPGDCQILLKNTVAWIPGGQANLSVGGSANAGRILVCASTDLAGLPSQLKAFCNAAGLALDAVAFHVYDVSLPPTLKAKAANPIIQSTRQLIAVPVRRGA